MSFVVQEPENSNGGAPRRQEVTNKRKNQVFPLEPIEIGQPIFSTVRRH
jgi:hypothetical protein